mmetsp:Transcript_10169/g.12236  ORF Transcript_10169/g.12236 Transcript_10169/m.12236 type:complete len:319 (-) Transcript_10169:593-1549(-)
MDPTDTANGLLLVNKVRRDWTAQSLVSYLSPELLDYVTRELTRLERGVKVRVLLSLLGVHAKDLEALRESINKLLLAAKADSEDWVQVTATLVEKFLPPPLKKSAKSKTSDEPDEQPKLYLDSISEIYTRIRSIYDHDDEQSNMLPADFLPLEWPYLSRNLLPKDFKVACENVHFVTKKDTAEEPKPASVPAKTESKVKEPTKPVEKPQESKVNPPKADEKAKQAENKKPTGALASILKSANKLTAANRKIIEDYLAGGGNPNPDGPSVVAILLSETRKYVDNKTAVALEQSKLKIDYKNRTIKKVKAVKKYKLAKKQ